MKRLVLAFWTAYFAVICLTNTLDLLQGMGLLPGDWRYLSGNLPLLLRTLGGVGLPSGLAGLLLAGVALWQGATAWLFGRVLIRGEPLEAAFVAGAGLWAVFLVADELLLRYDLEAVHLRLLMAQMVSFLVVSLLPDR